MKSTSTRGGRAKQQPRPQGFSLRKWVGREKALFPPHPFFEGKALGTRLAKQLRIATVLHPADITPTRKHTNNNNNINNNNNNYSNKS